MLLQGFSEAKGEKKECRAVLSSPVLAHVSPGHRLFYVFHTFSHITDFVWSFKGRGRTPSLLLIFSVLVSLPFFAEFRDESYSLKTKRSSMENTHNALVDAFLVLRLQMPTRRGTLELRLNGCLTSTLCVVCFFCLFACFYWEFSP